jgi:regulator of nucleoside diphosphate kinase
MTRNRDYHDALARWEGEGGSLGAIREGVEHPTATIARAGTQTRQNKPTLTDMDRCRLSRLLTSSEAAGYGSQRSRFNLEMKLEEAEAIPARRAPSSLVTMNSTIAMVDVESGERRRCTLVYPEDRDLIPHSVGVLQPLGQHILGRCKGDVVDAIEGGRRRRLKIEAIEYQPEAAGAYQL